MIDEESLDIRECIIVLSLCLEKLFMSFWDFLQQCLL